MTKDVGEFFFSAIYVTNEMVINWGATVAINQAGDPISAET
jgi:hypothetical protein